MAQHKTTKQLRFSCSIGFLAIFAMIGMGVDSCTEPSEYCKDYPTKADRTACTAYCAENTSFEAASNRADLIRACQLGQLEYLSNFQSGAGEAFLNCDHHFTENVAFAEACRAGVAGEILRLTASRKTHGTASDGSRETGNVKGK